MKALSLPYATMELSGLMDQVEGTDEEVVITRNGRPAAVLVSPDEYRTGRLAGKTIEIVAVGPRRTICEETWLRVRRARGPAQSPGAVPQGTGGAVAYRLNRLPAPSATRTEATSPGRTSPGTS